MDAKEVRPVDPVEDTIKRILERFPTESGGTLTIDCGPDREWTAAIQWGLLGPDSLMYAAAAFGTGFTAREAILGAVSEAGW